MKITHSQRSFCSDFDFRDEIQDCEIQNIPRKSRGLCKNRKTKPKKIFQQAKCTHLQCLRFENHFSTTEAFEQWQFKTQRQFAEMNNHQKIMFINGFVAWNVPTDSKIIKFWKDQNQSTNRFPKTQKFNLPSSHGGFGTFTVCAKYFKHIFGLGTERLNNALNVIWENRREGNLIIKHHQKYKGYKNTDDEPAWIQSFCDYAILHKNLTRSHYTKEKDTVYFELDGTEEETWSKLWIDYIKFTQPESYRKWVKKSENQPNDATAPKPHPSYRTFVRICQKSLKCKLKRVQQDTCNDCRSLQINIQLASTNAEKQKLEDLLKNHQTRACFMYQWNAHAKKTACESWKNQNLTPQTNQNRKAMEFKNTWMHLEIDYDIDRPECINNLNNTYFKRKITVKSLNMIQHPGDQHGERKIYIWSGMNGGKATEETTQCLLHSFQKRSIGAENCMINCDGAILTYHFLKFSAWQIHTKNPKKQFQILHVTSPETGHSRLEADTINKQANDHYKKKSEFSKCEDRKKYINDNTDLQMISFEFFSNLPDVFQRIFKDTKDWKDQFGLHAKIRHDKGMIYEFGASEVWNEETQKFEWMKHVDEMWIRCSENLILPHRKIKIFADDVNSIENSALTPLRRTRKDPPAIPRQVLNDTLDIASTFPNREELLYYYTPTVITEDGEIQQHTYRTNHQRINTKLIRRQQFNSMIQGNPIIALQKYPKKTKSSANSCTESVSWTDEEVKLQKVKELKEELGKHGVKKSGKKAELQERLIQHYLKEHKNHEDQEESDED